MKKYLWNTLLFFFLISSVGSAWILFSPAKTYIQSRFKNTDPKLLSVVYGDLMPGDSSIKVVKFQALNSIVLEFYTQHSSGAHSLVTRVEIPGAKNGFFDHRGQAVQLAVVDLDGDGKMELISPTFDDTLLAGLNPYHYSPEEEAFVPFFFSEKTKRAGL